MAKKKSVYWAVLLGAGALLYLVNAQAHSLFEFLHQNLEPHMVLNFTELSLILLLAVGGFYLSKNIGIPSFVTAIALGLLAKDLLASTVDNSSLLASIVALGATLILFGGGIETPWENFKRLLGKILSLSFVGLGLTAMLMSLGLMWIAQLLDVQLSVTVAILLGAILASTDPASVIPVLNQFRFNNRDVRDVIVSESAVTDVTGTLLTVVFVSLLHAGVAFTGILEGYSQLASTDTLVFTLKQIGFGVGMGVVGMLMLEGHKWLKTRHDREFEVDSIYFCLVPIFIFVIALALGGSGYLAAFIAGLLFVLTEQYHGSEKFFNQTVEGLLKPAIFILLGALVNVSELVEYAPIGLLAALVFMFVIRPIAVWISLGLFSKMEKRENRLSWRELVFISYVRETGAIPAVLLVTLVTSGIPGLDGLVPIGMWVILATLVLQPVTTPWIVETLKVGTRIESAQVKTTPAAA